jgi:surface antigen
MLRISPGLLALAAVLAACTGNQQVRQRPPLFTPAAVDQLAGGFVAQRFAGLDGVDRRRAAETIVASLENGRAGQPNPWRNPDSRNNGETVPGQPRQIAGRTTCREFAHTAYVQGRPASANAVACRDAQGVWSIVQ